MLKNLLEDCQSNIKLIGCPRFTLHKYNTKYKPYLEATIANHEILFTAEKIFQEIQNKDFQEMISGYDGLRNMGKFLL